MPHCLWRPKSNQSPRADPEATPEATPEPRATRREGSSGSSPAPAWYYSLRPRLVATCCSTSICLMASLRVKCTTSTQ